MKWLVTPLDVVLAACAPELDARTFDATDDARAQAAAPGHDGFETWTAPQKLPTIGDQVRHGTVIAGGQASPRWPLARAWRDELVRRSYFFAR